MSIDNVEVRNKSNSRKAGLELLRMFAALFVVMLHYREIAVDIPGITNTNRVILYFFESICRCAVDVFILISSFFLCKTQKRAVGKIVDLFFQVVLFRQLVYFLLILKGSTDFSLSVFLEKCVPNNYFVILYSVLYFISPYINILFEKLSDKSRRNFIMLMLSFFSIYAVLVDLSGEILGIDWFGLSPVGAFGNQQGFTIVNFVLIYCIGAYLRYTQEKWENIKASKLFITALGVVAIIFVWSLLNEFWTRNGLRSAWVYHNPFVILLSVCLLLLFYKMKSKSKSKSILFLSKAAFTCFLLNTSVLSVAGIEKVVSRPFYIMICHLILTVISTYLIAVIAHCVYEFTFNKVRTKFNKIKIPMIKCD